MYAQHLSPIRRRNPFGDARPRDCSPVLVAHGGNHSEESALEKAAWPHALTDSGTSTVDPDHFNCLTCRVDGLLLVPGRAEHTLRLLARGATLLTPSLLPSADIIQGLALGRTNAFTDWRRLSILLPLQVLVPRAMSSGIAMPARFVRAWHVSLIGSFACDVPACSACPVVGSGATQAMFASCKCYRSSTSTCCRWNPVLRCYYAQCWLCDSSIDVPVTGLPLQHALDVDESMAATPTEPRSGAPLTGATDSSEHEISTHLDAGRGSAEARQLAITFFFSRASRS